MFIDKARIIVSSGKGGDGHVSFRREKYVPAGGPDGGDGGKGGDVVFVVDKGLNTLTDFQHVRKYAAQHGEDGKKKRMAGKKGQDIVLLDVEDIFLIRVEDKQTKVYVEDKEYLIKKPLYQIEENLDSNFVRVSKTTIVNLRKIKRVAPSLKGMMFIELKNGLKDNISRKYLSDFKKALDL